MRKRLETWADIWAVVGAAAALLVLLAATAAKKLVVEENQGQVFWLALGWGLIAVLPYFALSVILRGLSRLHPGDELSVPQAGPVALESPGVTVDEVLDGPGSAALKRRILGDLLAVGDITRARYDAALTDPRVTGSPTR
jgi:hypothetical protein